MWSTQITDRPVWSTQITDKPVWCTQITDKPVWSTQITDKPVWSTQIIQGGFFTQALSPVSLEQGLYVLFMLQTCRLVSCLLNELPSVKNARKPARDLWETSKWP
ncbi:hypothetical protein DPMN_178254 [Dreissena polymorpha]|uniref:Uncharacterized protein n=1 Tax=Dreissena polymorpha TaxID=45954 RepID=A0A9D4EBQ5_DREPO|nr:hypothetical protein DPMN_178254 [Dreissena polymorpha]